MFFLNRFSSVRKETKNVFHAKKTFKMGQNASKYDMRRDRGGRGSFFTRRPPIWLKLAFSIWIFLLVVNVKPVSSRNCSYDEIEEPDGNGNRVCTKCPTCPPGQGLLPECGSYTSRINSVECVKCKNGSTYSNENNTQSCQPCQHCVGQKVIRICTVMGDAICGKDCDDGYVKDPLTEICVQEALTKKPTTKPLHPTRQDPLPTTDYQQVHETTHPNTNLQSVMNTTGKTTERQYPTSRPANNMSLALKIVIGCLSVSTVSTLFLVFCFRKEIWKLTKWLYRRKKCPDEEMPMHSIDTFLDGELLKDIQPDLSDKIVRLMNKDETTNNVS